MPPSGSGHPASCLLRGVVVTNLTCSSPHPPLPKGSTAPSVLPAQLSLLPSPLNRVLLAAGSPPGHPVIPGQTLLHLTTPVLPDCCRAPKLTSTDSRGCQGPGESAAGLLSKGMFPFPAPLPELRYLPGASPSPSLPLRSSLSSALYLTGSRSEARAHGSPPRRPLAWVARAQSSQQIRSARPPHSRIRASPVPARSLCQVFSPPHPLS